jgi:hypothetical protein
MLPRLFAASPGVPLTNLYRPVVGTPGAPRQGTPDVAASFCGISGCPANGSVPVGLLLEHPGSQSTRHPGFPWLTNLYRPAPGTPRTLRQGTPDVAASFAASPGVPLTNLSRPVVGTPGVAKYATPGVPLANKSVQTCSWNTRGRKVRDTRGSLANKSVQTSCWNTRGPATRDPGCCRAFAASPGVPLTNLSRPAVGTPGVA